MESLDDSKALPGPWLLCAGVLRFCVRLHRALRVLPHRASGSSPQAGPIAALQPHAVADFVLASLPPSDVAASSTLLRMGILIYAVYTTTNSARHGRPVSESEAGDMLTQAISNATTGHRRAEAELNRVWERSHRSARL